MKMLFCVILMNLAVIVLPILGAEVNPEIKDLFERSKNPRELTDQAGRAVAQATYQTLISCGDRAVPTLLAIATNEKEAVPDRAMAIVSLGDIRSPSAIQVLRQSLTSPYDPIRYAAIAALGEIGGEAAVSALCEVLARDPILDIEWAYKALSSIDGTNSIQALAARLSDPNHAIVCAVQESLSNIPSEAAVEKLATSLRHGHKGTRRLAAELLGRKASPATLQYLRQSLGQEKEPLVRIELAASMLSLGETNETLKVLHEYSRIGYVDDRCSAIKALGRVKNDQSIAILKQILKEREPLIRACAVEALAQIGGEAAWAAIGEIAKQDEWLQLRQRALALLEQRQQPGKRATPDN